jgi:DNA polymerase III epsilon subunit family exonuclease
MSRDLVAFDLETTGLSPKADRIIEIGAVRFRSDGTTLGDLQLLVDPEMPIPLPITRLTGIGDGDVHGMPGAAEAAAQLADFCDGADLVAHGAVFDMAYVTALLPDVFGHRVVHDTLDLARILLPLEPGHGLQALGRRFDLRHERPHRALSDATATVDLFWTLLAETQALAPATLAEMRRVAAQAPGALAGFLDLSVATPPRPRREPRGPALVTPEAPILEPVARSGAALEDSAAALLESGRIQERPGYEHRPAQVAMARAVAQVLDRGGRLLVEAGTGVGKTLGYLAPLGLAITERGGRAVVATHTIALQEQLLERELPTLQPLLARPVRAAILKGRRHYISLRRWQRFLARDDRGPHGPNLDAIRFKLKVLRWLEVTRTGDRGELRLSSTEREQWRLVESEASDCLGSACANWAGAVCHMVSARRRAAAAELVITNHAMLLAADADEAGVLGDHDALVVDEAHHLEEAATRSRGHSLSHGSVGLVLARLPGVGDADLAGHLEECRVAAERVFGDAKGVLIDLLGGPGAGNGSIALTDDLRDDARLRPLLRSAERAIASLMGTAQALRAAAQAGLLLEGLPQPDRGAEELELAAAALDAAAAGLGDVLLRPRPEHVAWLELRAEHAELHDAPVRPAEELGGGVLDRARSTVLTSATLAVAGDFGFIRERLGLRRDCDELIVASPFDYLEQAICVVVGDAPAYDAPEHDRVLAQIIGDVAHRLGGRTLALFTGYGPLRHVHDMLGRRLAPAGISVLGQGIDGTRRQILQSFIDSPRTVLLGTNSFWEGIDVPGDALQCVVIAKLPFAVPTDPLVRARTDVLDDPFGAYILPQAIIRLRQGFGRLIRSQRDRGAVVICDPRILERRYGQRFLEALPRAAVSREPAAAVASRVAGFLTGTAALAADGGESGYEHRGEAR